LEKYHLTGNEEDLMLIPELEDDEEEYEVEEVKDKDVKQEHVRYLVKWLGWPSEYNQWVSEADIANAIGKKDQEFRTVKKVEAPGGRMKLSLFFP